MVLATFPLVNPRYGVSPAIGAAHNCHSVYKLSIINNHNICFYWDLSGTGYALPICVTNALTEVRMLNIWIDTGYDVYVYGRFSKREIKKKLAELESCGMLVWTE